MLPGFINIYHSSLISIQEISIDHDLLFRELMKKCYFFFYYKVLSRALTKSCKLSKGISHLNQQKVWGSSLSCCLIWAWCRNFNFQDSTFTRAIARICVDSGIHSVSWLASLLIYIALNSQWWDLHSFYPTFKNLAVSYFQSGLMEWE
jgi:hypothetical protein